MEQRNCKNCGSPLEHSYNHKCKYCGTLYDFNEPEEEVVKVSPHEMVEVRFRDLHQDIIDNDSIILRFEGIRLEMPKIYEYTDEFCLSKAIDWRNPPKAYFMIKLSKLELEKYGVGYLLSMLSSYLLPKEVERVREQLTDIQIALFKETRIRLRQII